MHPKEREKMCGSCDGRIPVDAQFCPYCTAEQSPPTLARPTQSPSLSQHQSQQNHRSLQESLSAPYSPPYQPKFTIGDEQKFTQAPRPQPAQTTYSPAYTMGAPQIPAAEPEAAPALAESSRGAFWPILTLSLAANFLILGLLQLLFSDGGRLRLEWDSTYWFVYCLASLPLFFFGLRKVL